MPHSDSLGDEEKAKLIKNLEQELEELRES